MPPKPRSRRKPLHIETKQVDQRWVITLAGSIHLEQAPALRQVLERAVALRPPAIVLDLAKVDFMSSTALGVIVWAHIRCRYGKGVVRLVAPSAEVARLLEMTRLVELLPLFDSVEEALKVSPGK